jgi:hypothetical protein
VSLAELRALDDGSVLQQEWIGEMAVRWAARRAAASQTGSDGAAWVDGRPAGAVACDATLIPVVTGQIDPAALDDLVGLCLLCRRRHNRHYADLGIMPTWFGLGVVRAGQSWVGLAGSRHNPGWVAGILAPGAVWSRQETGYECAVAGPDDRAAGGVCGGIRR